MSGLFPRINPAHCSTQAGHSGRGSRSSSNASFNLDGDAMVYASHDSSVVYSSRDLLIDRTDESLSVMALRENRYAARHNGRLARR